MAIRKSSAMHMIVSLLLASLGPASAAGDEGVNAARIQISAGAALTDTAGTVAAREPAEAGAASSSPVQRTRRVQPRVSSTRCAFVTCTPECRIKGSRNARGEQVYRRPESPEYEQSRTDALFCSAEAARAAGYKEAGNS